MAERFADDTGSESVFDFYCQFCREDGKILEAEGYCVDCGEYLCSTCYTHHKRSRGNRHHVLMDKDKMPKDTPLSHDLVNKDISKKCDNHRGKHVEYYCKSHDFLGCNMCIIEGHRNCNNIENIAKVAESIMEGQEFKSYIQMLNEIDQRSHNIIKLVKENIYKSQNWCSEVTKSVHMFREEINSILDELEKSILTQTENLQKEEEKKMKNISDQVTSSLQSIEKISEEFDHLQTSRKVCEIYIKFQESQQDVKTIQARLDEAEKKNIVSEYFFDPNTTLKEYLNSQNGFGKLSAQASVHTVAMALPQYNPVNTKATHLADIEVNYCKDEEICLINGSAVVSNNRLVITDYNNCNVKLIDVQGNKVICELAVYGGLCDVTVISRNQVAIIPWGIRRIRLLSVSDTLTLDREITVSGYCRGLAYSKNGLVVTYFSPAKLEIMDLSGKVMKTVDNDSDGNELFVCPLCVCVSKDEETIYVSDSNSNKVTSLTFDGVVKSVYSDSELKCPEKVCVDHHGNVYVCGSQSRNIHMLTADLIKIQIILTQQNGLDNDVWSVSHCQKTNRLYVGMKRNKVKVYQLSQ